MLSNFIRELVNNRLFNNQLCAACGLPSPLPYCVACQKNLPRLPAQVCPICSGWTGHSQTICGRCQTQPLAVDKIHAAFSLDYPLHRLLHDWKYRSELKYQDAFYQLMRDFSPNSDEEFDWIVPVPLSSDRLQERGFNQSLVLAEALAGKIKGCLSPNLCVRKRNTSTQAQLNRQERAQNLQHAFGVNQPMFGANVVIVDDVATSGATLNALALSLKKQGVNRVEAWVLARAFFLKT